MASILDLSESSDSENDVDYEPPTGGAVDSEGSSESGVDSESEFPISKKVKLDDEKEDKKDESFVDKKTADDVWKNFLKDVGESTSSYKVSVTPNVPKTISEDKVKEDNTSNGSETTCLSAISEDEAKNVIRPVDKSMETLPKKTLISDEMPKEKDKISDSESTNLHSDSPGIDKQNDASKKRIDILLKSNEKHVKGLSSVLGAISAKDKKMSVLEKSKNDWMQFKESENISEDLETFNKGKLGFLERQRFLARSDLRLFESEKSARLGGKKK